MISSTKFQGIRTNFHVTVFNWLSSTFSLDESLIITNDDAYLPEEDDDEDELHNNHLQNVLLESCAAESSKHKGAPDMDYSSKSPNVNPSFMRHMELSKFSTLAKTVDESGNRLV